MVTSQLTSLYDLFKETQGQMVADLKKNAVIGNPGEKGEDTNKRWVEWFNKYLPGRYHADKGIVIDCNGNTSDQIDLVIYDRNFSPPLMEDSSSKYVMSESVYAVFEIKQKINKPNIEYAMNKAESVRRLNRTCAPFREARGTSMTEPKPVLAGILSKKSVKLENDDIRSLLKNADGSKRLDLGCSVEDGSFVISEKEVTVDSSDISFIWFFYSLLSKLREVGSVAAIDYSKYLLTGREVP